MYHEFNEEIPLSAAEIYAFMRTPADWTRLYGSFGDVADRGDGWHAVPLRRFPFPLVARIVEDVPERKVAWEFRGFWRGTGGVELATTATGTLVTGYEDISIPRLAGLGRPIERRYFEPRFRAVWDSGWRRLRRMAAAHSAD